MLRPATPLAGIFFFATALLLLSSLTTPVISRLSLATFDGSRFGVWGYCSGPQTGSRCSPIEVGYKIDELRPTKDQFSVSEVTRHNVSYILIIHPIAALLSFACFCMATATHFHAPGHSPRFLMALFILTLPTFLIALLAFLVDILLFIPHLSAGGWFVLASVVLLLLASIVTCGMRRTLISRKARRKRIAENSEMNGDDYYARQAAKNAAITPPLSGASDSPLKEKTAVFGSYDSSNGTVLVDGPVIPPPNNDININFRPANMEPRRNQGYDRPPPIQVPRNDQNPYSDSIPNDYYNQAPPPLRQERNPYGGSSQSRIRGGLTSPTRAYSQERSGRMGAPPQYGYDQPSRGMRPDAYNNGNGGRGGGRGGYDNGPSRNPMGSQREVNPYQANVAEFAPRSNRSPPRMNGYPPVRQQQQQQPGLYMDRQPHAFSTEQDFHSRSAPAINTVLDIMDKTAPAAQSQNQYTSNNWARPVQEATIKSLEGRPTNRPGRSMSNPGPATFANPPDVPIIPDTFWATPYPRDSLQPTVPRDFLNSTNSNNNDGNATNNNNINLIPIPPPVPLGLEPRRNHSLDSLPLATGQRSPARSDYSHFTSVSQRGINPYWRQQQGLHNNMHPQHQHHHRRRRPSREQMLLDSNPDFSLPPTRSSRGGSRAHGGMSRSGAVAAYGKSSHQPSIRRSSSLPHGMLISSPLGGSNSHLYPSLTTAAPMTAAASAAAAVGGGPGIVRDGRYPAPSILLS